jgi:MFS superfamily sulfate permease-like transporter
MPRCSSQNSDHFERRVHEIIDNTSSPVRQVVIAAEPITDVDTSAAAMLQELVEGLRARGIELELAELKGPVKDRLRAYGLYDLIGEHHFHSTIGSAVKSYVEHHNVEWTNWDEP